MMLSCGKGKEGQLGHGDTKDAITPAILDLSLLQPEGPQHTQRRKILQISCGRFHSACVTDDGVLYTWGSGEHGRLGHGDEKSWLKPSPCSQLSDQRVITVSCGAEHTAVLCQSRTAAYTPMRLYTWGYGRYGRLGLGNEANSNTPTLVASLNHVDLSAVACGTNHTVVLSSKGEVYSAGNSDYGQLGHGDRKSRWVFSLVTALEGKNMIKVACGGHHTAVVMDKGKLFTFGRDNNGQLGLGSKEDFQSLPKENKSLAKKNEVVIQVACGGMHTAVITQKGKVYTFGCGTAGRLGHGDEKDQTVPVSIKALKGTKKITKVSCGTDHTAIVTEDGEVQTFGSGAWGQLGHFDESLKALQPTHVKNLNDLKVELVATGGWHTLFTIATRDRNHYDDLMEAFKKTNMADKPPVQDSLLQQIGGSKNWNRVKVTVDCGALVEAKLEYPSHIIPKEVQILVQRIRENALRQEGVFRLSPNTQIYNQVKMEFYKDPLRVNWGAYDDPENALAPALLKDWLRGMKSTIFDEKFEVEDPGITVLMEKMRELDLQKRCLLKYLLELFEDIVKETEHNRMTIKSLTSVFIMGRGFFEDIPLSNLSNIGLVQKRRADIIVGLMKSFRVLESMGAFPEDMRLERKKSLKTSTTIMPMGNAFADIPPPTGDPPVMVSPLSTFIPPPSGLPPSKKSMALGVMEEFIPPPPGTPPKNAEDNLHPLTKHVLENTENPVVVPRRLSNMSRLTTGSYVRRVSDPSVVYSIPPPPADSPPLAGVAEEEGSRTTRAQTTTSVVTSERHSRALTEKSTRSAMKGSRKKSQQTSSARPTHRHVRVKRDTPEIRVRRSMADHISDTNRNDLIWLYIDDDNVEQGPFSTSMMEQWFGASYFKPTLKLRTVHNDDHAIISKIFPKNQNPFTEASLMHIKDIAAESEYDSYDEPITDDEQDPASRPVSEKRVSLVLNQDVVGASLTSPATSRTGNVPHIIVTSMDETRRGHAMSHADSSFTSISRQMGTVVQTPMCHTEPVLLETDDDGLFQANICIENTKQVIGFVEITSETTLDTVRELMDEEFDYIPDDFQFLWTAVPVGRKQEARRLAMHCVDAELGVIFIRTKNASPAVRTSPEPVKKAAPEPPRRSIIIPKPPLMPPTIANLRVDSPNSGGAPPATPSTPINSSDLLNAIKGLKKAKVGDRPMAEGASAHAVASLNSSLEKMMENRRRAMTAESQMSDFSEL